MRNHTATDGEVCCGHQNSNDAPNEAFRADLPERDADLSTFMSASIPIR